MKDGRNGKEIFTAPRHRCAVQISGHVRGIQDCFGLVPALARVVDADGPDIDSLGGRGKDEARRHKERKRSHARWISHGVWLKRTETQTDTYGCKARSLHPPVILLPFDALGYRPARATPRNAPF